ncbi:hypothetical protein DV515_00003533 [Chloebia gouldiae]|uniref:Uncharacterized protein n=1 Tax=Chloebia gouldiae TaxID=44316 RepID=A0A3L8SSD1_CHLGU|nr:hypothetical protein DV515_00003533 [Chloebia gouldiae]
MLGFLILEKGATASNYRPSTVNKGKQQGCYHGEKSQGLISQWCKISASSASGVIQRGGSSHEQVLPKPDVTLETHGNSLLPVQITATELQFTPRLFHSSRQLFWCLHFSAAEQESEEILGRKKPHSRDGMISTARSQRSG